jgi:hypothetical protein
MHDNVFFMYILPDLGYLSKDMFIMQRIGAKPQLNEPTVTKDLRTIRPFVVILTFPQKKIFE